MPLPCLCAPDLAKWDAKQPLPVPCAGPWKSDCSNLYAKEVSGTLVAWMHPLTSPSSQSSGVGSVIPSYRRGRCGRAAGEPPAQGSSVGKRRVHPGRCTASACSTWGFRCWSQDLSRQVISLGTRGNFASRTPNWLHWHFKIFPRPFLSLATPSSPGHVRLLRGQTICFLLLLRLGQCGLEGELVSLRSWLWALERHVLSSDSGGSACDPRLPP